MTFWTAHLRAGGPPVLVREGFSWGALFFGPFWLAAHKVWIPALLTIVVTAFIVLLSDDGTGAALLLTLVVLLGFTGHDLRRWSLDHRGYLLAQVILAHNETDALASLLGRRPDLKARFMPPEAAR